MTRVLVTGAAGFIGSTLCERLLEQGHQVWGVDCFDDYYPPTLKRANIAAAVAHPDYHLLEGDLRDTNWLRGAIGGESFELVYHLAARAGVTQSTADPISYASMNTVATLSLLEVIRQRPTRLVFASSSSIYGGTTQVPFTETDTALLPTSPYAALKRSIELMLFTYHHLYGLPSLCLRFFTVYGPRQRPEMAIASFTRAIDRGDPITLYGDGTSERDYTYIDDIVDGALAASELTFDCEILNLGGSRRTRLIDLIRLIEKATGKEARVEHVAARREELDVTWADTRKASERLGYAPRVEIEDGVARYYDWYCEHRVEIDAALTGSVAV